MNPCGLHMESCWVNSYSLCSEVESMLSRWSNWTPTGLHMDSRQKIDWATTRKKMSKVHMDSGDWPGLHMESVGEGKVLYSLAILCSSPNSVFVSFPIMLVLPKIKMNWISTFCFLSGFYGFVTKPCCLGINGLLVLMPEHMPGVPQLSHLQHFLSSFMTKPGKPGFNILNPWRIIHDS